jgi:hypothetical protein
VREREVEVIKNQELEPGISDGRKQVFLPAKFNILLHNKQEMLRAYH